MKRQGVSVCMATYNGAPYLQEQVGSILAQLEPHDEIVFVDDASTDGTPALLEQLVHDPRVRVFRNEHNQGHVATFARAIGFARHNVIFTSDQDDRWIPGRLSLMLSSLDHSSAWLVSSNMTFIDSAGATIQPTRYVPLRAEESCSHWMNVVRVLSGQTGYYGCAMGMRAALREIVLPIPSYVESHDLWIALAANLIHRNLHVEAATLERRVHSSNASIVSRPLPARLRSRLVHLSSIAELVRRSRYRQRTHPVGTS